MTDAQAQEQIEHWCEVCGVTALLTSADGVDAGWDFPPHMGAWGVVSPRTCGNCTIDKTLWWALTTEKLSIDDLVPEQRQVLARILNEAPD